MDKSILKTEIMEELRDTRAVFPQTGVTEEVRKLLRFTVHFILPQSEMTFKPSTHLSQARYKLYPG